MPDAESSTTDLESPRAATEPNRVVVLAAHGSRAEGTAEAHRMLCAQVAQRIGASVEPAFLEISTPSIPEALDGAAAPGVTLVSLVPYFLHLGNHVRRDLPEMLEEARARHPGVTFEMAPPVGSHPGIVDLLADCCRPDAPTRV